MTDLTGNINPEREFVLAERPLETGMRDAVNVWLQADDGSFGMRLGVEALAEEWDAQDIWLDIAYADGRVISLRDRAAPHPALDKRGRPAIRAAGPLSFECVEPFRNWRVRFNGRAAEVTALDLIHEHWPDHPTQAEIQIDIEMTMAVPPWAPGSLSAAARAALQGEQGQFMSPRYEQLFNATGHLSVNGVQRSFGARGLRIRRQGARKFAGFSGHCWQSALFPSGKAFGFNVYPPGPDGTPSFSEGYIFTGAGELLPARVVEVPWLQRLAVSGDDVSCTLETDRGRISIRGVSFANTRSRAHSVLPADFPIVQQSHVLYQWNNEITFGMLERSSLREKMQF